MKITLHYKDRNTKFRSYFNAILLLAVGLFASPHAFAQNFCAGFIPEDWNAVSGQSWASASLTTGDDLAQSFTACEDSFLTSLSLQLGWYSTDPADFAIEINVYAGDDVDTTPLATIFGFVPDKNIQDSDGTDYADYWSVFDLTEANIELVHGEKYTIQFLKEPGSGYQQFGLKGSGYGDIYEGGHAYQNDVQEANKDYFFQIESLATYEDFTLTADKILDTNIKVTGVLDLAGHDLFVNGHTLVFGCGAGEAAIIAPIVDGTGIYVTGGVYDGTSGSTPSPNVIIEHCYEASRAFRLVSSPVTTGDGPFKPYIKDNWQEGVNNISLDYAENQDPNPGYGTHISGSTTGASGFDATASGKPSLFYWDEVGLQWSSVGNTDATTLGVGDAYRLLIRGNRSIDLNTNSSGDDDGVGTDPTATILRTRGVLNIGTYTRTFTGVLAGQPVFVGNPKHAPVDMDLILQNPANSDFDAVYMYVWDVLGAGGRGAYQVIALPSESGIGNIIGTSTASQYLQPGEAAFLQAVSDNPTLTVLEGDKILQTTVTTPYKGKENPTKDAVTSLVKVNLYEAAEYIEGKGRRDGLVLGFNDDVYSNSVDKYDAIKFFNGGESIAVLNGSNYLSVETRKLPENGDVFPLFFYNYQDRHYVLTVEVSGFRDGEVLLYDAFEDKSYALNGNGKTAIPVFDINEEGAGSYYRFEVRYTTENLGVKNVVADGFVVYPNPVSQGELFINAGTGVDKLTVKMFNLLGQEVFNATKMTVVNNNVKISTASFAPGVYILKATDGEVSHTQKIIIK